MKTALDNLEERRIVSHFLHNEPGWRRGPAGWIRATPTGADFSGIFPNCMQWVVEAKTIGPDEKGQPRRMELAKVTAEQQRQLWAVAHAGGPALLAIRFRWAAFIRDYLVPWQLVPWKGVSFRVEAITAWECKNGIADALVERWGDAWRKEPTK